MGRKKSATGPFLPGFLRLAPSIHVRDTKHLRPGYPLQRPHHTHRQQQEHDPEKGPRQQHCTCNHQGNEASASFASSSSSPPPPPSGTRRPPNLVIIFSWTGAIPKHIVKYTEAYKAMYPGTPILLITTAIADLAFHSTKKKIKALAPAIDYLCSFLDSARHSMSSQTAGAEGTSRAPNGDPSILLHAFSEGGANKAVCLAQGYQARRGGTARLPVGAFIFDSTPGTPRYASNVAAFRRALPRHPVAQAVGLPVGAGVLGVTWVLFCVFVGYENNLISKTRRALNDAALWDVKDVPRTYLFSEADDLICWRDVEAHGLASAAPGIGVRSLLVRFKATPHCCHTRGENAEVYWEAVRRTWEAKVVAEIHGPELSGMSGGESSD